METTNTCIQIPEGTDLNEIFNAYKQAEIDENNKPTPLMLNRTMLVSPMQRKVLKNKLLLDIINQIEPIDFAANFSDRKSDPVERQVRWEILSRIRAQKEKAKNAAEVWAQIKEEKKFTPNISKKIIYIIEAVLQSADKIGLGIVVMADVVYMYDGKKWSPIARELMDALLEMAAERTGLDIDDAKTARTKFMFREQLNALAVYANRYQEVDPEVTICLNNGVFKYDGQTVSLEKHDKERYFTYCLDFDYDQGATYVEFQRYLDKVLPDKEHQALLQEYLGYCLSGGFLKHEKALVLYGPLGAGGKSVLHDCLEFMFKRQLMSNYSMSELSDEKCRYGIQGKLINYCSELDFSKANMEIFKQLTSCEPVSARKLYDMYIEVKLTAKQIMNANSLPDRNLSESFFRRLIILPFFTVIKAEEANIHLAKELAANESAGIFNWMVAGLKRLTARGYFDIPNSVQQIVNQYKHDAININSFLDEKGWVPDDQKKILLGVLYGSYREFTLDTGFKPFNINNFAAHLRRLGFEVKKMDKNKTYVQCSQFDDFEKFTSNSVI